MDELDWMIVYGAALPFVLACAFVIPLSKRCEAERDRHAWRIVLAVGVPVVIAFSMLFDWPRGEEASLSVWWSNLGQDQLVLYTALAGIAIGLVMSLTPRNRWLRGALIVVLAALVTLATWPMLKVEAWYYRSIPAVGTVLIAGSLEIVGARRCGFCLPFAASLSFATTSVLVIATGFQPLGFSALAGAVALGALALLALWRRKLNLGDGTAAVIAPLIVMPPLFAWVNLMFYGDSFPAAGFLLPMLAPLALLVGEAPKLRDAKPVLRGSVVLGLVLAMCVGGVAAGYWPSDSGDGEQLYDEMGFPIDP